MTREEAIKILKAIRVYECYPKSASEETKEAIDMAIEALENSEPKAVNRMSDLIRREDAIEAIAQQYLFEAQAVSPYVNDDDIGGYRDLARELLAEIPSADAAEVVRCKDCKHRYISGNGTTRYYVCDFMDAQYEDNGFCHHGERKGGEE